MKPEWSEYPERRETGAAHKPLSPDLRGEVIGWLAIAIIGYLCWLLVAPFVPAFAFSFALAMLGEPLFRWLVKKLGRNTAAFLSVLLICLAIVVPVIFLMQTLIHEAIQGISALSGPQALGNVRNALEHSALFGTLLRSLDSRVDLPDEALQLARGAMQWLTTVTSSIVSGSAWAITQIATMIVVLFYFLRDQESILANLRSLVPLSAEETNRLFARITETIRVSLYGKAVVAGIQGGLGGLIFWWLDLPAPAFWGFVMALLSVLPVLGAFVIWVPVALALALHGQWGQALLLTGWGILIVHPVDNFLGPVLVGTKLRLHTLFIFFSVIGGLAAFGASGIVLGPVIVAIVISMFDIRQRRREDDLAANV